MQRINNIYCFQHELGSGGYSKVQMCVHKKTGQQYAVKIIEKKPKDRNKYWLDNEIKVMKRLSTLHSDGSGGHTSGYLHGKTPQMRHPNIVQLRETFEDESKVYLVMEQLTGGCLFDRMESMGLFSERDASNLIRQVLQAVDYLHEQGIVHRDLKPENLMFANKTRDSKIVLIDFGLAMIEGSSPRAGVFGTPGYMAPEMLAKKPYGKAVDLWSIGVITYCLLCGYLPIDDDDEDILYAKNEIGAFQFDSPSWDKFSDSAKDFIAKLMCLDVEKRLTCKQALAHPWISGQVKP
ncbi:calcium/calmodulin-dependent protein kinase type 1-like [Anopheles nili]|uniref:calcium/calmodulin-dependent protein kinase type 1-like n=1 Tax=Anopheles nili TaxID=185578 RepID=UPI00237B8530|nr:calcium/calmodulin-dependent protein kinase type 1-like [Anopheles nili]